MNHNRTGSIRQILIKLGTVLGLIGDYNAPSLWSNGEQVVGTLTEYLQVERDMPPMGNTIWDIAAIVSLKVPLHSVSLSSTEFTTTRLLLIQRYPEVAWDDQCLVHVYAILDGAAFDEKAISKNDWMTNTTHISLAATVTILKEI